MTATRYEASAVAQRAAATTAPTTSTVQASWSSEASSADSPSW